jgi:hypothetical protein
MMFQGSDIEAHDQSNVKFTNHKADGREGEPAGDAPGEKYCYDENQKGDRTEKYLIFLGHSGKRQNMMTTRQMPPPRIQ